MWWSYEDARERKAKIQRQIEKRRKLGESFEALAAPTGKQKLCTTFWGQSWCQNLESYRDFESRLPRGRSYLRQGNVYNVEIKPQVIRAVVAGSELYETSIHIQPLSKERWRDIVTSSAGEVGSMLDLLAGKLGDGLMRVLTDHERGLFPKPKEIRFDCSCPDYADMCKHVAAVLYGVGVLLDTKPELLFTLRGVDQAELLSNASAATITDLASTGGDLGGTDLSALFGIELGDIDVRIPEVPTPPAKKQATQKPTRKQPAKKAARKKNKPN